MWGLLVVLLAYNCRLRRQFQKRKNSERLLIITGWTVHKLTRLVKENEEIIDETKKLVKADIMRGMIAVVLNTDMDEDGILSDGEIQRFVSEDEEFGCYKAQGKEV